jgi:hypothetical protein
MKPTHLGLVRHLTVIFLLACAPYGCGTSTSTPAQVEDPPIVSWQDRDIGSSLERATNFLLKRQSPDGAWRSEVYAPFREGDALTPIVLLALESLPRKIKPEDAIEHGLQYLERFVNEDGNVDPPLADIAYPVYMAAGSILALGERRDERSSIARQAWVRYLCARQLTEQNGWDAGDIYYGGWGYSSEVPQKPPAGTVVNPLMEPNNSATVFALEALRAARIDPAAAEFEKARQFVERCQNFSSEESKKSKFDDGGFFFLQTDAVRNKAGIVGRDADGRERYSSYGSATVDGLRALFLCGADCKSPRVRAAVGWLKKNYSAKCQPGSFDIEAARDSVYYYYARSMALLLRDHRVELAAQGIEVAAWADELARELIKRQRPHGSWKNSDGEVREDDPLLATALAVAAISACHRVAVSE